MKIRRILSLVLVLAMFVSMLTVGTVTASAAETATGATKTITVDGQQAIMRNGQIPASYLTGKDNVTVVEDGVTTKYTVISNYLQLYQTTLSGNLLLATDIDFYNFDSTSDVSKRTVITLSTGAVFNGNCHTFTGINLQNDFSSLFLLKGTTTVKNLNIGTEASPAKVRNGVFDIYRDPTLLNDSGGNVSGDYTYATFDNVHLYVNNGAADANFVGGFLGAGAGNYTLDANYNRVYDGTDNGCGSYLFNKCSVAGTITGGTEAAGGFIGRVIGAYGEVALTDCTNYATVTNTGAAAGGFVGACGARVKATRSINKGAVVNNADLTVTANHLATGTAGFVGYLGLAGDFEDCVNAAPVTGPSSMGGFVGHSHYEGLKLDNCINTGNLTCTVEGFGFESANNKDGAGGLVGTIDNETMLEGESQIMGRIVNCANYGNIYSATRRTGGILGSVKWGGGISIEDTSNHGAITVDKNRNSTQVGGIIGLAGEGSSVIKLTRCVNYASVESTGNLGGICGEVGGKITAVDCLNLGNLTRVAGTAGAGYSWSKPDKGQAPVKTTGLTTGQGDSVGGFAGWHANNTLNVDGFANLGTIYMATGTQAGRISGVFAGSNGLVITSAKNVYSFGKFEGPGLHDSNFGYITGLDTSTSSSISNVAYLYAPTLGSGVVLKNSNFHVVITAPQVDVASAVSTLNGDIAKALGLEFINDNGVISLATPVVRATQETVPADNKQDVRLIASINTVSYQRLGLNIKTVVDGVTTDRKDIKCFNVYTSIKANNTTYTAADFNGAYLYALTFTDVPSNKNVEFIITPYAETASGTRYNGETVTVHYENGARATQEPEKVGANSINVATYNIMTGNRTSSTNLGNIANWVKNTVNADLVGYQEVWQDYSYSTMKSKMGTGTYSSEFATADNLTHGNYGNALFWKTSVFSKVSGSNTTIPYQSGTYVEDRVIQMVRLKHTATGEYFTVINTHYATDDAGQKLQTEKLLNILNNVPAGDHIILMGDLNHSTHRSPSYYNIMVNTDLEDSFFYTLNSTFRYSGKNATDLCNTGYIDFVYADKGMQAVKMFIQHEYEGSGSTSYSDHRGYGFTLKF